jgi:UDP-N-acetylmuramate dehydrogenase
MMAVADRRLVADLAARLPGRVRADASIGERTTYRVGGTVAALVTAGTLGDLGELAAFLRARSVPLLVVGRGSNLLVADDGFPGVALVLEGEFESVALGPETVVAGGAVALPVLARQAATAGRGGLEFLVGIPGSVGGAVRMNAGGHGRETKEVLRGADTVDLAGTGTRLRRDVTALDLGYRRSVLRDTEVVVSATFTTVDEEPRTCEARLAEIVRWRREHQPGGANAGSVFTNPPGDSAGRLIDAAGLKGLRVGGAVVSDKHANFIQADPGASAADVRALVLEVQRRVAAETGVRLRPELRMVGFPDDGEPS